MSMNLTSAEPILRIHAELADIQQFGKTPYGERRIINILGGTGRGPAQGQHPARRRRLADRAR